MISTPWFSCLLMYSPVEYKVGLYSVCYLVPCHPLPAIGQTRPRAHGMVMLFQICASITWCYWSWAELVWVFYVQLLQLSRNGGTVFHRRPPLAVSVSLGPDPTMWLLGAYRQHVGPGDDLLGLLILVSGTAENEELFCREILPIWKDVGLSYTLR